jgi:hypothetical protein
MQQATKITKRFFRAELIRTYRISGLRLARLNHPSCCRSAMPAPDRLRTMATRRFEPRGAIRVASVETDAKDPS